MIEISSALIFYNKGNRWSDEISVALCVFTIVGYRGAMWFAGYVPVAGFGWVHLNDYEFWDYYFYYDYYYSSSRNQVWVPSSAFDLLYYYHVGNEIAWGTIETDVPYLKMKCESLLKVDKAF